VAEASRSAEPHRHGPAEPRPWRPTGLLWASAALHASALAVAARGPWRRAAGGVAVAALLADHAALAATGLWPRSRALGPNLVRLPAEAARRREVALTFDDGPDAETTPRVLDLLERHGARATFFLVGERVARRPELAAEIVRRGHRVENHTYRHPWNFSLMGPEGIGREIDRAQKVIVQSTGQTPRWVRAPAGLRNLLLEPVLARRGLGLASWSRRGLDAMGADPERVLRRLTHGLGPGEILVLHDAPAATGAHWAHWRSERRAGGACRQPVLEVLPALLDHLRREELRPVPLPLDFGEGREGRPVEEERS